MFFCCPTKTHHQSPGSKNDVVVGQWESKTQLQAVLSDAPLTKCQKPGSSGPWLPCLDPKQARPSAHLVEGASLSSQHPAHPRGALGSSIFNLYYSQYTHVPCFPPWIPSRSPCPYPPPPRPCQRSWPVWSQGSCSFLRCIPTTKFLLVLNALFLHPVLLGQIHAARASSVLLQ